MKKYYKVITLIVLGIALFTIAYYIRNPLIPKIQIGDTVLFIELAVTPQEKEKGLGGRDSLKPGWGMLFPYDHKEQYRFWMKGMKFPLDFVWFADKQVVDLTYNVLPPDGNSIPSVQPSVPVDQILELNAGDIDKYGITVGDKVIFHTK